MTLKPNFQGPVGGGNLPQCNVLRCVREGDYLATLNTSAGFQNESLICAEHKQAIDGGAPWRWDDEQRVYLMGSDVDGDSRFIVDAYRYTRGSDVDSTLGWGPIAVELTNKAGEVLQFVVDRELGFTLGTELSRLGQAPSAPTEP
jgi:hypothetical protein